MVIYEAIVVTICSTHHENLNGELHEFLDMELRLSAPSSGRFPTRIVSETINKHDISVFIRLYAI